MNRRGLLKLGGQAAVGLVVARLVLAAPAKSPRVIAGAAFATSQGPPQPYQLAHQDIELLSAQTDATLINWYLELNRWKWPKELGPEEPPQWPRQADGLFHMELYKRSALMDWIEGRVSKKRILRVHNHRMTDEQFEMKWAQWSNGPFRHLYPKT